VVWNRRFFDPDFPKYQTTQSIAWILFFQIPGGYYKNQRTAPHTGVNSELPLKDITLESVNPGGVGLGFNPQDSRGVHDTACTHLGRFVFF